MATRLWHGYLRGQPRKRTNGYSPWLAIYAVNRPYLWNSDPCFIRVHPWLKNEKEKEPSGCILATVSASLTDSVV
jgi:hypothetical protein